MIEELIKIEKMFLDNKKDFRQELDLSPFMLCLIDENMSVYLNRGWLDFTGGKDNIVTNEEVEQDIHLDDVNYCWETIRPAFVAHVPYHIKYRLKHASGEYRWVREEGIPLFNKEEVFKGFIGGCVDIDIQKKVELQLLASEQRYRRLFETARDGILLLDSQTGEITDVNPFLVQLLGYSKEEFLGKKLWEVGAFKNMKASKKTFKLLQDTGYVRYDDLPLEASDGRLIEVEFVSNAYTAGEERVMQCNIRDISERKRLELADKNSMFLEQEKMKSKFIADATHELRTPLAIIKGNVDLALRDKEIKGSIKGVFRAINVEINHLAGMLSDLTMLTTENQNTNHKISKNKIKLSELITHVVERCTTIATTKNITIQIEKMPNIFLVGDKIYLGKLFSNIINNAIYYGKENGFVTINIKKDKKYAVITIADNGLGITKEDLPNIFSRFYRTDTGKSVNHNGTGLGLAISKWIVEAHNGTISVTSVDKEGTTFTINLPLFS